MAVQTSYDLYTRDAVVGALYGISLTNSVRHSYVSTSASIPFGVAVSRVAGLGNERKCALGGGGVANVHGLSIRVINKQMQTVPGTGAISYQIGEAVGVLMDGFMNVLLADSTSVTDTVTSKVFVNDTTGAIATHATAIAGYTEATNMKFESTGVAGDIVVISIARVA